MISRHEYEYWVGVKFDVEVESDKEDFSVLGIYLPSGEEITDSLKESTVQYIERQLMARLKREAREDGPTRYENEPITRDWWMQ